MLAQIPLQLNEFLIKLRIAYEKGQGLVEYALIIILVVVVVIGIVGIFGGQVRDLYTTISNDFPAP